MIEIHGQHCTMNGSAHNLRDAAHAGTQKPPPSPQSPPSPPTSTSPPPDQAEAVRMNQRVALNDDAIMLSEIRTVVPKLEKKLARGKEYFFRKISPFKFIREIVENDPSAPWPATYHDSVEHLAEAMQAARAALAPGREQTSIGIVRITRQGHHAAFFGLNTKARNALLFIDSVPNITAERPKLCANIDAANSRGVVKRIIKSPKQLSVGSSIASSVGFHEAASNAFGNIPDTSIYYAYTGTQSSFTDCASFAVASVREMQHNPLEEAAHYALLRKNDEHIAAGGRAEIPGLQKAFVTNSDRGKNNVHFVLDGAAFLTPSHYVHTQSRSKLAEYCRNSPHVTPDIAAKLFETHDNNRQKVRVVTSLLPKKANLSIRKEQIKALELAQARIEARLSLPTPAILE